MRASIQALVLLSVVTSAIGKLYTSPSQLPTKTFDYVIVGAGAAGPVVANRLSEDKGVSVLLLEAGESNEVDEMIAAPLLGPTLTPNTRLDWNYSTIPQIGYNSRSVPYIRGHVLGGTTSINYMIHNTGPIDDWEYYAKVTGDQGWSWQAMRKYFYKAERMVPPADGHYTKGQWNPKVHGKDGMVKLSLPGQSIPLDLLVLSATEEFHQELPYNVDQNSGKPLGIGWAQTRTGDGLRDSSATSYLGPKYLSRPNLHVLLHARVTRVYPTGRTARDGKLVFRGVEFLSAPALTTLTRVEARKEVILSAGVINTPHILQLSGIGERIELARVGIKQLVNLPSVGKNMSDHPLLLPTWNVTSKDTFDPIMRNDSDFAPEFQKWKETRKGVMTDTVANLIAWHRLPSTDRAFKVTGARDPSTGPNAPHVELIFYNSFFDPHGFPHPSSGNYMTIFIVLVSPSSRGFVTLSSNSPLTPPVINPNYFGDPFDSYAITSGLKLADKIVTSDPWKGYIKGRFSKTFEDSRTDDELLDYVVNNAFCLFHGVGTASMSPKGASWGVVDPDLRVKGIVGLRVVDASVIPYVPSAHPMGPIYAVAERASELIKVDSASIETEIGNILPYDDDTQKPLFIFYLLSGLTGQPALIVGAILAVLAYLGVFRKRL